MDGFMAKLVHLNIWLVFRNVKKGEVEISVSDVYPTEMPNFCLIGQPGQYQYPKAACGHPLTGAAYTWVPGPHTTFWFIAVILV